MVRYLKNVDSLIAAITGFFIVFMFSRYSGIGVSPDSIMYASTAENIRNHGNLITFNGGPLVFFPFFYPFFLSITIFLTGHNPIGNGPYIDGLLFAAVIFLCGWTIDRFRNPSIVYKWLVLLAIILSPGVLEVYTYLWSETLFILMTILFIIAYRQYLFNYSTRSLIFLGLVAAIGCITRYAGVTLVGTGGLLLLLDSNLKIKKKITHIFIFGAVSVSLLAINLIINKLSSGLGTGTREPSITPFRDNLYYFGTVMFNWAGFPASAYPFSVLLSILIFLFLIGLLIWKVIIRKHSSYENIYIAFTIVYGLFIVISATFSRYERINSRLLSPMAIPLIIGLTSWIPDGIHKCGLKNKLIIAIVPTLLMGLYIYNIGMIDYQRYDDQHDYGIPGYTDDDWNKSDFVMYLKKNPALFKPGVPIYSNANEAVYIFAGKSSLELPHVFFPQKVNSFYQLHHYYLVWFKALGNTELLGMKAIQEHTKLTKIADTKDGAVYWVE